MDKKGRTISDALLILNGANVGMLSVSTIASGFLGESLGVGTALIISAVVCAPAALLFHWAARRTLTEMESVVDRALEIERQARANKKLGEPHAGCGSPLAAQMPAVPGSPNRERSKKIQILKGKPNKCFQLSFLAQFLASYIPRYIVLAPNLDYGSSAGGALKGRRGDDFRNGNAGSVYSGRAS
jgi:hypothetical protein